MSGTNRAREMRRDLGRRLRELRGQAGLSQQEVARQIGYTRSAVSNVEAGGYAQRQFWERCDELFGTGGTLARAYDEIRQQAASPPGGTRKPGRERESARQGLELLRHAREPADATRALAAYQKLGWPVEEDRGQVVLVTGTMIDVLELPRPAGVLAARWWLYTGGTADEVRGLPALPRPDLALVAVEAGHSCPVQLSPATARLRPEPARTASPTHSAVRAGSNLPGEASVPITAILPTR